jgi:hypothetical protein
MKGQRMLTSDTILQGSWQNIKLDPELARLPKWQVMQSEARTALMHLSGQIEVDALPLDGSCLSKSFNRAYKRNVAKLCSFRSYVHGSSIDLRH